jgi:cytochrome b6-f complex iron-sulfur subunit
MTSQTLVLVGVAGVAILAALAAFVVTFRRSAGPDWRAKVERDAVKADRGPSDELVPPVAEPLAEPVELPDEDEAELEPVGVTVASAQRLVEVSAEEAGITRRTFFNRALGATFGTFVGVLALDMLAFLWPKVSGGFGADVNVGKPQDLLAQAVNDDGSVTPVFIPEARAYIVPAPSVLSAQYEGASVDAEGLMALYQRCVHLGCRVPWCQPSQGFECPCHGSKYNGIGEYFDGPAPRNLDRFELEVNLAGDLIVKTGSIYQSPRAPESSVKYPQGPSCIAATAPAGEH